MHAIKKRIGMKSLNAMNTICCSVRGVFDSICKTCSAYRMFMSNSAVVMSKRALRIDLRYRSYLSRKYTCSFLITRDPTTKKITVWSDTERRIEMAVALEML